MLKLRCPSCGVSLKVAPERGGQLVRCPRCRVAFEAPRATEEAADPEADAYVLSCTNVHAPEVIEPLEDRLGRPVIASNPATLWHCLRLCGREDVLPQLGKLMRMRGPSPAGVA